MACCFVGGPDVAGRFATQLSSRFVMLALVKLFTVLSGLGVILAGTAIKSVLSLMLTFIGLAMYWLMSGMDVLGVLLVLVYVGAVIVLFLFVVMMIGEVSVTRSTKTEKMVLITTSLAILVSEMTKPTYLTPMFVKNWVSVADSIPNLKELGVSLFECQLHGVLGVGVVLLVAMIGGVSRVLR